MNPSPDTEFCAAWISAQIENTIISNDMDRKRAADYLTQFLYTLKPEIVRVLMSPDGFLAHEAIRTKRDVLSRGTFKELLDG